MKNTNKSENSSNLSVHAMDFIVSGNYCSNTSESKPTLNSSPLLDIISPFDLQMYNNSDKLYLPNVTKKLSLNYFN